ncbi:MAG TPA: carbon-nitrogen hydrolase family protein [Acidimicrobiia bacterium]|nr:carbon-nitrogen hydrolase family protein [Acidimicrobiia bacterium]
MTETAPTALVAAVQATPVFLDREATVEKVGTLAKEAAAAGARLVAFPEGFVPTYPDWVWRTTPWADGEWYARWIDQCVDVPGATCDALGDIARENDLYLAVPVNERDGGTVYNTLLYFGPDGALLGKHRKLVATGGERLAWGMGDGSTLPVFDTPFGRFGGLICWENYMPLARAAMYEQGVDILLAPTWDNSDVWVSSMRHIAKEGRCYVLGITSCLRASDVPADIPGRDDIYGGDDDWMSRGNSVIVDPYGDILAGPISETEGILYAEVDIAKVRQSRRQFDVVGHYARPDVFKLSVRRD